MRARPTSGSPSRSPLTTASTYSLTRARSARVFARARSRVAMEEEEEGVAASDEEEEEAVEESEGTIA